MAVYTTRAELERLFGEGNIAIWATLDGVTSRDLITARITQAITDAQEETDAYLRGGVVTVPFTTVPTLVAKACARLAGVDLYESRGLEDESVGKSGEHRFEIHRRRALEFLGKVKSGAIRLAADPDSESYPEVVSQT